MNSTSWQQLEDFIEQQKLADKSLWVALSGGVDSICLLHLAKELKRNTGLKINAVHVNHGLSQNADNWQKTVSLLCKEWGIELICCKVDIHPSPRTSLEQQARDARYEAIAQVLPAQAVLLTGHHQADQFETFILRLMRGSGLTGLTSMKPLAQLPTAKAKAKDLRLARPLLSITKQQILEYAKANNLTWVEDESNQDQSFDRNFVRASLLPLFQKRWPSATRAVEVSASLLEQEAELLQEYLEQDLKLILDTGFAGVTCLNLASLKQHKKNKQASLIRLFVHKQSGLYPSRTAIDELLNNLIHSRRDSQPELKLTNKVALNVYNEQLYVTKSLQFIGSTIILKANEPVCIEGNRLYSNLRIYTDELGDFSVKFGEMSDKLVPNLGSGSKKVKELLKQHKCPPWYRSEIPLIYHNNKLIAVGNTAMDINFKAQLQIDLN